MKSTGIRLGLPEEVDVFVVFENGDEQLWSGKVEGEELKYISDMNGKLYFSNETLKRAGVVIVNTVVRYANIVVPLPVKVEGLQKRLNVLPADDGIVISGVVDAQ